MALTAKFIENLKARLAKCNAKEILDCYIVNRYDPDKYELTFLSMRKQSVNYSEIMNLTRDFAKVLGMEKQYKRAMAIYFDAYEMHINPESLSLKLKEELLKYGIEIEFKNNKN